MASKRKKVSPIKYYFTDRVKAIIYAVLGFVVGSLAIFFILRYTVFWLIFYIAERV